MVRSPWDDDDDLLADLALALDHDAGTEEAWLRAGEAALTWRTVDGELAALSYDSLQDEGLMARARTATVRRTVVFEHALLRIELELTAEGVVGQLVPMAPTPLVLEGVDGPAQETESDDAGSFLFDVPAGSPFRLRCRVDGQEIATDWIGL